MDFGHLEMPIEIGLIGHDGADVAQELLTFTEAEQTWRFDGLGARPTLSLNRGFSAPIKLTAGLPTVDRLFQLSYRR